MISRNGLVHIGFWVILLCGCKESQSALGCRGDCTNGQGVLVDEYGNTRAGYWQNGQLHGPGQFKNQWLVMDGNWENGELNGQAVIRWLDCEIEYRGSVQRSERKGQGARLKAGDTPLTGIWFNNHMVCVEGHCNNGSGRIIYIDKDHSVPSPHFGLMDTPWQDWDEYHGMIENGIPEGTGKWVRDGAILFEGPWNDGQPCMPDCSSL